MKLTNGTKVYHQGGTELRALDGVDLTISRGEVIVILGASGSGKSTLLQVLAGLDEVDGGTYTFEREAVTSEVRKRHFGFIFQSYHLLDHLNVVENILVGANLNRAVRKDDVMQLLDQVGMADKVGRRTVELSGGEQQRVAIARALIKQPDVLFCDEPTGALDEANSKGIIKLMLELNASHNTTMVIVTHNPILARIADRVVWMRDGKIASIEPNTRTDILDADWSLQSL
jgi:putative ABC transport system ATP-binding protein